MAKELFSMAAQEQKGSARERKRRRTIIIFALIFAIAFIGQGIFHLKDFPFHIPFQQAVVVDEHQAAMMQAIIDLSLGLAAFGLAVLLLRPTSWSIAMFLIFAIFMGGSIVYSDLAGFEIVQNRALGGAYALCLVLPISAIALMVGLLSKRRAPKDEE
jgi:hypothetical protein